MAGNESSVEKKSENELADTIRIIVHALIIAVLIRIFIFQPFNIPSGSMKETLLIGDYLFVSKFSYGYSHHSLPFSPKLFKGRFWSTKPKRGDVAVFKNQKSHDMDYIKRVIGLPGDTVQMRDGVLFINGRAVPKRRVKDFIGPDKNNRVRPIARFEETLPNGKRYFVLDQENSFLDTTPVYHVPVGHYFMMGDNRDNSQDSRVLHAVGYVPLEKFVGRANRLFFSFDKDGRWYKFWRWPADIRWSRMFSAIK